MQNSPHVRYFRLILGEISCLFLLALEFFTRFRGGSFQPLTHLSGKQRSVVSYGICLSHCAQNDQHL